MSEVKLIIPRQPYGNLQRPGAGRIGDVRLSPEGMAALDRLTTCSRGAVLDLAVQVLDVVVYGQFLQLEKLADKLLKMAKDDSQMAWLADGFKDVGQTLQHRIVEGQP